MKQSKQLYRFNVSVNCIAIQRRDTQDQNYMLCLNA